MLVEEKVNFLQGQWFWVEFLTNTLQRDGAFRAQGWGGSSRSHSKAGEAASNLRPGGSEE